MVEEAIKSGKDPVMTYHRYWAQAEVAMANAMYHIFFEQKKDGLVPGINSDDSNSSSETQKSETPDYTPDSLSTSDATITESPATQTARMKIHHRRTPQHQPTYRLIRQHSI